MITERTVPDAEPIRDRGYWARQSLIDGTDWQSLHEAALAVLRQLDAWDPTSFRQLCAEADRQRDRRRAAWSAAGRCINSLAPRKALKTFLKWCDQHDVVRADAMFVFEAIVDKELAK
jgi:hypothetical protein